jgi:hypothetical protein
MAGEFHTDPGVILRKGENQPCRGFVPPHNMNVDQGILEEEVAVRPFIDEKRLR